jgi:hypothetical protein
VVYNSLEDKNSSNLYIQGFLSTDSMQVSPSDWPFPCEGRADDSSSRVSFTPESLSPPVDQKIVPETYEVSSWPGKLSRALLPVRAKLMGRVQSRPQADEVIARVCFVSPSCVTLLLMYSLMESGSTQWRTSTSKSGLPIQRYVFYPR